MSRVADGKKPGQLVWYEEYRTCSCSNIQEKREDLPGYCPKHGTQRKTRPIQIPGDDVEFGWAGQ